MQMKNSFLEDLEFAQDINKLQIPKKNIWQSYINEIAIMIVNIYFKVSVLKKNEINDC